MDNEMNLERWRDLLETAKWQKWGHDAGPLTSRQGSFLLKKSVFIDINLFLFFQNVILK